MTTNIYRIIEYHMKDFPKIRDPRELKYIDLLNYFADAQIWEKKIRDLIEFDKEHSFDIPNPTGAGEQGRGK
jgi:hypothetical protein